MVGREINVKDNLFALKTNHNPKSLGFAVKQFQRKKKESRWKEINKNNGRT